MIGEPNRSCAIDIFADRDLRTGVSVLPYVLIQQAFFFPWLVTKINYRATFQCFVTLCGLLVAALPYISAIQTDYGPERFSYSTNSVNSTHVCGACHVDTYAFVALTIVYTGMSMLLDVGLMVLLAQVSRRRVFNQPNACVLCDYGAHQQFMHCAPARNCQW